MGSSEKLNLTTITWLHALPIVLFLSISALGLIFPPRNAAAQQPATVENHPNFVSLGNYEATKPASLADLPQAIVAKLNRHLVERFGADYYARLSFAGGQIVDFDELYRVNPSAKQYQWKVFAYRLGFMISAPEKGIKAYYGFIELDRNGDVQKEIEFPAVRLSPVKADFITLDSAYQRSIEAGLSPVLAELQYSKQQDSIVIRLSRQIADNGLTITYRTIEIDAHTRELLRDFKHQAIR
jgi:hypothetical protein